MGSREEKSGGTSELCLCSRGGEVVGVFAVCWSDSRSSDAARV